MQSKLLPNQIEKTRERYREHPLLVACKRAFGCYESEMQELLFAPEEIFLEASIIIDKLLTEPENAKQYINGLWIELKTKIRYWDKNAPQEDLNRICGAVFYVVAAVLCQHYHHFYNDELKEMMLDVARKNMSPTPVEEERVIIELSVCADGLLDWLSDYIGSYEQLSEEIIVTSVQENPKGERLRVAKIAGEKPHKPPKPRETMTFRRKPEVTEAHLKLLFLRLAQEKWISGNEADFCALFSGKRDEDCVVIWLGKYGKSTLVELFQQFIKTGLVILPEGFTLSAILEGHFKDKAGQWLKGLDKGDEPNKKALPEISVFISLLKLRPDRALG